MSGAMNEFDRILDRIRAPILQGRMTKRELARRAGLPETTLIGMEKNDWNPRAGTLRRLLPVVSKRPLAGSANQDSVAA